MQSSKNIDVDADVDKDKDKNKDSTINDGDDTGNEKSDNNNKVDEDKEKESGHERMGTQNLVNMLQNGIEILNISPTTPGGVSTLEGTDAAATATQATTATPARNGDLNARYGEIEQIGSRSPTHSRTNSNASEMNDGNVDNALKAAQVAKKLEIFEQIQERMMAKRYKFPWYVKYISNGMIILWTLLCAVITSLWCLWFDVMLNAENEFDDDVTSECSDGIDIPEKAWANFNLTQGWVLNITGTIHLVII